MTDKRMLCELSPGDYGMFANHDTFRVSPPDKQIYQDFDNAAEIVVILHPGSTIAESRRFPATTPVYYDKDWQENS